MQRAHEVVIALVLNPFLVPDLGRMVALYNAVDEAYLLFESRFNTILEWPTVDRRSQYLQTNADLFVNSLYNLRQRTCGTILVIYAPGAVYDIPGEYMKFSTDVDPLIPSSFVTFATWKRILADCLPRARIFRVVETVPNEQWTITLAR